MAKVKYVWLVLSDDHLDYYHGTVKQAEVVMNRINGYSISAMPGDFMTKEELAELPSLHDFIRSKGIKVYG